jgi:hypothetical protein
MNEADLPILRDEFAIVTGGMVGNAVSLPKERSCAGGVDDRSAFRRFRWDREPMKRCNVRSRPPQFEISVNERAGVMAVYPEGIFLMCQAVHPLVLQYFDREAGAS